MLLNINCRCILPKLTNIAYANLESKNSRLDQDSNPGFQLGPAVRLGGSANRPPAMRWRPGFEAWSKIFLFILAYMA